MDANVGRTDLLPAVVPGHVVLVLAVAGVLLWVLARYLTGRYRERLPWYGVVAARVAPAMAAAWCGFQALARWTELAAHCPIWLAAVAAGVAVEGTAALYMRERRVISKRLGVILTVLRGLAVLLALVMLMQPVLTWTENRAIIRRVAVLVDESDSMRFIDKLWTPSERFDLAVHADLLAAKERPMPSLDSLPALQARLRPWVNAAVETNVAPPALTKVLEDGAAESRALQAQADGLVNQLHGDESRTVRDALTRLQREMRDSLAPAFVEALTASSSRKLQSSQLLKLGDALDQAVESGRAARDAADLVCWSRLPEARRIEMDAYCTTSRVALAHDILLRKTSRGDALLARLAGRYDIDLMRLGRGAERMSSVSSAEADTSAITNGVAPRDWESLLASNAPPTGARTAFRSLTDYPAALETVLKEIPSDQLAGVLILSDGCNNGDAGLDPVGRRLGMQGVPVCGIVVGGSRLPLDVAIADVKAPESVYLGDKIRIQATIRVMGAKGRRINVTLSDSTGEVDRVALDVSTDDYTREIRLTHEPKERGFFSYTIHAEEIEGELFKDNNTWKLDVAVSDDRTNVLLADDRSRWEFRYLRNLFFGRDKSVHLQYFLEHPDNVSGITPATNLPPVSASRKFGEAEAGALPVSREEWRKFDVIILGDVGAELLTPEVVTEIKHCVSERGALLVVSDGPRAMPHGIANADFQEMLPIRYGVLPDGCWQTPEPRSHMELTAAGKAHPVMQQSTSMSENEAIWNEMANITWRFPVRDVKPGAEVLAYAQSVDVVRNELAGLDVAHAAARLDAETRKRARDSLIVVQNYGRGKVVVLNFDQTWRLRDPVGDKAHHRFWSQVVRWGVGEKLRAGKEGLRLGTDELVYTPQHAPRILARVTDEKFSGISDANLEAVVRCGGKEITRVKPTYREGSQGMYEVAIPSLQEPGRYDVVLTRKDGGKEEHVETAFLVVTAERPLEWADVSATREHLDTLARWTGGRVVTPVKADELWNAFGERRRVVQERRERPLWDRYWMFLLLLGLLTTEWILRKRGGLT